MFPCFLDESGKENYPVTGSEYFDDSSLPEFTPDHYLSGFITCNIHELIACQFIYQSSRDNHSRIVSPVHGRWSASKNLGKMYRIDAVERILCFHMTRNNESLTNTNGTPISRKILKLQFITTKNTLIPPYDGPLSSDTQCEHGANHVLSYVTGIAASQRITDLEFVWKILNN